MFKQIEAWKTSLCVCSGSIFYAHYGHFSWSVIGKTMTSSGSGFFSSHYSIMLEQSPLPLLLAPWLHSISCIVPLGWWQNAHFSVAFILWPFQFQAFILAIPHTHTNTRTAEWGGYAYICAIYVGVCGRVCVCHLCSRINKCLRRELNFLLPHPEVCTKVNVPLAAPPRRDGRTLRICLSACQIACEIFSKYIYTPTLPYTHTPSTPTHFVQLNYFIRKERFFIVFFHSFEVSFKIYRMTMQSTLRFSER